jgi:hypothetical protein
MEYTTADMVEMDKVIKDLGNAKTLSLDIQGGFSEIPPLEIVRALRAGLFVDVDTLDRLTRYALMNKVCVVKADGVQLSEGFIVNALDTPWDTYPIFREYPVVLEFIFNLCQSYIVKKSTPPLKSTPVVVAKIEAQASGTN